MTSLQEPYLRQMTEKSSARCITIPKTRTPPPSSEPRSFTLAYSRAKSCRPPCLSCTAALRFYCKSMSKRGGESKAALQRSSFSISGELLFSASSSLKLYLGCLHLPRLRLSSSGCILISPALYSTTTLASFFFFFFPR